MRPELCLDERLVREVWILGDGLVDGELIREFLRRGSIRGFPFADIEFSVSDRESSFVSGQSLPRRQRQRLDPPVMY